MSIQEDALFVNWTNMVEVQQFIHRWANVTFPGRKADAALFKLVMEEVPELLQQKKLYGTDEIGEELADCFVLLLDLAALWKVDISTAIRQKMRKNMGRTWAQDPDSGLYNHVVVPAPVPDSEGGEI